jgi:hypothetical protein
MFAAVPLFEPNVFIINIAFGDCPRGAESLVGRLLADFAVRIRGLG